ALLDFAVKHAHRVYAGAFFTLAAPAFGLRFNGSAKFFVIGLAADGAADGVYFCDYIGKTKAGKQLIAKTDNFNICGRVCDAEKLNTYLVELALATLLRLLIAKHGSSVVELVNGQRFKAAAFHHGADDTGCAFGAHGVTAVAGVGKCIHLFADHDVAGLSGAAGKQV